MSNEFLDAAIEYASKGMAVFPLKPRAKEPITKNGVKDATTNFNTIEKWWSKHPNSNIGIACGQPSSGLLVIDLDVKENGINGMDTLHNWERDNGELPETVRSITGKGGAHILYRIGHKEKNRVNLLEGVDVRSDGGYIVAPPSVHPNGRRYEWEYDPEEYDIAEADETVMRLLSTGKKAEADTFVMPETVQSGKRNDTIYKLACSLQGKGLPDEVITATCQLSNESMCNPPLDTDEVDKIVESALKHDKGHKLPAEVHGMDLLYVTDSKGNEKIRQCAENVARVILSDPTIAGKIKDDTFGHRLMYLGQLDWREQGDTIGEWTDKDDSALRAYLDIKYGLRNKADYDDGFNMALFENRYNPLVGYLDALQWDGKPRINEALTKFLGADPSEYNVSVLHTFLQGAVRRAYDPGCKFDYMMVLIGKQGDGKSTFFKMLACNDEWYDENFNFKDTNSKTTIENMAGKWVLEMGEMDTMKKDMVTADALKAFVSTQADSYRVPFGKRPERRARQCVFCGTSNDVNFLKDRTGNRRYLPVDCHATRETKNKIFDYDTARPYFQQVVAEAVHYYKQHKDEPLTLPHWLEETAKLMQEGHMEEDVWVSIIQDFLDNEPVNRINAAFLYDKAFDRNPVDMRKGETSRILTIMRNDIKGWHEVGKARMSGYGNSGICFERDPIGDKTTSDASEGDTKISFTAVPDDEIIPF